jgi:hypothetical protein
MRKASLVPLALLVALAVAACTSAHRGAATNATNAAAGTTVTGKVVSFTGTTVEIQTAKGHQTLAMDAGTRGRERLMVGALLAFAYDPSGRGLPVVTRITTAAAPQPH